MLDDCLDADERADLRGPGRDKALHAMSLMMGHVYTEQWPYEDSDVGALCTILAEGAGLDLHRDEDRMAVTQVCTAIANLMGPVGMTAVQAVELLMATVTAHETRLLEARLT